jgi:membrane protease subunit (stomatin/prohibitin family)
VQWLEIRNKSSMQARSHLAHTNFSQRASARRRIRRTHAGNRLFCTTNGCATFMQPDGGGKSAICPVCGARRTLH